MSGENFARIVTEAGFVVLFVIVLARAIRRPRPATLNAATFFASVVLLLGVQRLIEIGDLEDREVMTDLTTALILLFPYLLLRLANDFLGVRARMMQGAALGLVASVLLVFGFSEPMPGIPLVAILIYFFGVQGYASVRFLRAARRTRGLTQHRLAAVSVGTGLILVLVAFAIPAGVFPDQAAMWANLSRAAGLGSGTAFLIGFALPGPVKAMWQTPEVRRLASAGAITQWLGSDPLEDFIATVRADVERVLGAQPVVVWLWDEHGQALSALPMDDDPAAPLGVDGHSPASPEPGAHAAALAVFHSQVSRIEPREHGRSGAHLAAPVSLEGRRLGVISAFGGSAAAFAEDDLWLLELFAGHLAFALQHRDLLLEVSEARARMEANQLKEDFLSSAAHDLQTPLTTLLGEAQLMIQRARRDPDAPLDMDRANRLIEEAQRMRTLVREFLDASRADHVSLLGQLEALDLADVVAEATDRAASRGWPLMVEITRPCLLDGDRGRLLQVVENLLENATKYSPSGSQVAVRLVSIDGSAHFTVADSGIGIAPDDLPHVFDRFWRSRTVDARRFAGMGLGLYISRRIVEDHGGTIRVESVLGRGSTFSVALPLLARAAPGLSEEASELHPRRG